MYPFLRILKHVMLAKRKPILLATETSILKLRVWFQDIDGYGELNNGRFLTMMDIGRIEFGERTRLNTVLKEKKWGIMVGATNIRYRRRLTLFTRFELHTQLLGFDDRWFYFHQFTSTEKHPIHSSAIVRTAPFSKNGLIPIPQLLDAMKMDAPEMELPEWVKNWVTALDGMPKM